jgi:CHAT domain-containing protein
MISLWSVTNYSSSLFYKHFYQALSQQENKSFHDAFKTAREKLAKEKYKDKYLNLISLDEEEYVKDQGIPQHTHQYILIDAF